MACLNFGIIRTTTLGTPSGLRVVVASIDAPLKRRERSSCFQGLRRRRRSGDHREPEKVALAHHSTLLARGHCSCGHSEKFLQLRLKRLPQQLQRSLAQQLRHASRTDPGF